MSIGSVTNNSSLYGTNSMLRPAKPTEEEAKAEFEKNDVDKSGGLNKEEFAAMHTAMNQDGAEQSESLEKLGDAIFKIFDADSDGEVTAEELDSGRESMIGLLQSKYGGIDTMDQVKDILNQTQTTLIDMMNSNNAEENDTFSFLSNNYSSKIQAYLDQAQKGKDPEYSSDAISALLNSGSISKLI